jgi:hypothetical protein
MITPDDREVRQYQREVWKRVKADVEAAPLPYGDSKFQLISALHRRAIVLDALDEMDEMEHNTETFERDIANIVVPFFKGLPSQEIRQGAAYKRAIQAAEKEGL